MLGNIFIPPSPNWFLSGAIDSREEDAIVVTASFKNVVVYQLHQDVGLPKILMMIPYSQEKVHLVSIYPDASHDTYGKTVGTCGDLGSVRLYDLYSGDSIWHHIEHQSSVVTGLSWGVIGEEPVLVSIDDKSRLVVSQPRHRVTKVHKFPQINEPSCLEVSPKDQSQALVIGGKLIYLIDFKVGRVLMQFQGHNSDVFCVKWFHGKSNPFTSFSSDSDGIDKCTVSQEVKKENEKDEIKDPKTDNWRKKVPPPNWEGPFFVSSDYGRQVLVWDLDVKRYIAEMSVPISASFNKKFYGKERVSGKQHISLHWYENDLISTTPKGEVLLWKLYPGGGRYTVIHHLHSRAIYTLTVVGDIVVSSGQDRFLQAYHLGKTYHMFQFPTLGACASTLSFCPHDVNRLAIGTQENIIRLINFESDVPLRTHIVWQIIKGKVLAISWHPNHEGKLLFGTASGQVGWIDIAGRVTSCAYYHQKSVYKVEWAPLICPQKIGLKDAWCAYSFGDREIVIRSSSDPMADPVQLLPLLSEPTDYKPLKDVTEFSFSCDYKYFAVGSNDGQVRIYSTVDLKLCVTLHTLRKAIQHILWQPPTNSSSSYVVALGSNENRACIFNLSVYFEKEHSEPEILTQATRELCGHESRVVWLAWSPHNSEILASASYDHTVQLWNVSTGQALVNYGGHRHRVFRVEFSPSDPDLLFSFAEENTIHSWRPSQLKCKTPSESLAKEKERAKKMIDYVTPEDQIHKDSISSTTNDLKEKGKNEKKSNAASTSSEKSILGNTMVSTSKKGIYKSFFPKLHSATSRKKSFFHFIIVNLLNSAQTMKGDSRDGGKEIDEELSDALEDSSSKDRELDLEDIERVCKQYHFLLEKDAEMPNAEDLLYALRMYGKPHEMDSILMTEISEHVRKGNAVQGDLMHCWQGSLDEHIRNAARQKQLSPFLVSSAPQVSIKLWEFASEAYAEQLVEEGDIISAATYLVNINKVEEAIDLLLNNRFFREAMAIAKCRRAYSDELVQKIISGWIATSIYEGAFDFAASLQISIDQIEEAAATLARRNDHGPLFVASLLYRHAEKKDLAKSIGLLSLKEACVKQDYEKINCYLPHLPELQWFRIISVCHENVLKLIKEASSGEQSSAYCILKSQVADEGSREKDDSIVVSGESECRYSQEQQPLLAYLRTELCNHGFNEENYSHLYDIITSSLSTHQLPTSVKQLWFLVAVAVCEMLMSPTLEFWESHLMEILDYALSWGKVDQAFHLSHILLPQGIHELSTVVPKNFEFEKGSKALSMLLQIYHVSDLGLLHSELQCDDAWNFINQKLFCNPSESVTDSSSIDDNAGDEQEVAVNVEADSSKYECAVKIDSERPLQKVTDTKFLTVPQSTSALLSKLHSLIDFLVKDQDSHGLMKKIIGILGDPKELLLQISLNLKEKGNLNNKDVQELIFKISALKS